MEPTPTIPEEPALESDPRFPLRPRGQATSSSPILPGRHWMELQLTFREGTVQGEGRDWVGPFLIRGRYDVEEGKCWWSKRYVARHDVAYMGYNEGRGIWGTWEMADPPWRGGFHVWPEGMNVGDGNTRAEEAEAPDEVSAGVTFEDAPAETLEPAGVD